MKKLIYILTVMSLSILVSNFIYAGNDGSSSEESTCNIEVGFDYEVESLNVKFANTSIGDFDVVEWDFGDGERKTTEQDTEHTYNEEGVYEFCLTATNSDSGCSQTFCGQLYVFK